MRALCGCQLLALGALACAGPGEGNPVVPDAGLEPAPRGSGHVLPELEWRLADLPVEDLPDGALAFLGEGGPAPSHEAALREARASALAQAAFTRESKIVSAVSVRVRETERESTHELLQDTRLDSEARFAGARALDQEVQEVGGQEPRYFARVRVRLAREQVFLGDRLRAILEQPKAQRIESLWAFVREARSRRDADAQAVGLSLLLDDAPERSVVLELVDLLEDQGRLDQAQRLARRWQGRIDDDGDLLARRAEGIERQRIDVAQLVERLLLSLRGARSYHTVVRAPVTIVRREGPEASVRVVGRVREGRPVSFLWIDSATVGAPSSLVLDPTEVQERFEWELVDWNEQASGFVPGMVSVAVLAGTADDPAPRLEPEVPYSTVTGAADPSDRDRLARFVTELQQWLQRGENEACLVSWTQR